VIYSDLKYAVTMKNQRLNDITNAIGSNGLLLIYSGVQPANPDTALSGNTLLAQLPLSAAFAGAAVGGVLTANAINSGTGLANGTPTWGSLVTSGGVRKVDFSVGPSSGFDLVLNSGTIYFGAAVSVQSLTITSNN
jgi:hypothetical protein